MRRAAVLFALAACSAPKPTRTEAPAPVVATDAPHEVLDVQGPSSEDIGPLVPYAPASAWTGKGIPPKQFSLFALPDRSPLLAWSALDRDACEAELGKRRIGFARAEDTAGVRAPIRLTSKLHGVGFHSRLPEPQRAKSKADLIDCRLAIALDEFAKTLATRDIDDVVFLSAYRSNKEGGCTAKYPGEQHCAALAVDVGSFHKKDGKDLVVDRDFKGKIGTLTCATSPPPNELWEIACHAAGRDFQVILTPNWNQEHHNHFHLELTTHEWMLVR